MVMSGVALVQQERAVTRAAEREGAVTRAAERERETRAAVWYTDARVANKNGCKTINILL